MRVLIRARVVVSTFRQVTPPTHPRGVEPAFISGFNSRSRKKRPGRGRASARTVAARSAISRIQRPLGLSLARGWEERERTYRAREEFNRRELAGRQQQRLALCIRRIERPAGARCIRGVLRVSAACIRIIGGLTGWRVRVRDV